jgi:diacylglycerol kinase
MEHLKKNLIRSFQTAFRGLWWALSEEPAFKYMIAAALVVFAGIVYFPTKRSENIALITMIFAVLGLELINSVLERFLDFLQPQYDEQVRTIKDIMAAIVLLTSIGAALIGILIFWPYIIQLF